MSLEEEVHFGPVTRRLLHSLNSGPFLSFLEKLTKLGGLVADPHFRGGGLHRIERGGKLGVHADYNYYRRLGVYRRLNLLIYLNDDWKKEWGGHLELWDREKTGCVRRVLPALNRAVIFDTSNRSYHGHPEPLNCPSGMARRSLALYYYSVDYPYKDDLEPHTTAFIDDATEAASSTAPDSTSDPVSN